MTDWASKRDTIARTDKIPIFGIKLGPVSRRKSQPEAWPPFLVSHSPIRYPHIENPDGPHTFFRRSQEWIELGQLSSS